MWVAIILLMFITIWMTLTFTNTLCDNETVGMGLCWRRAQPVGNQGECPICPDCPTVPSAPSPSPGTSTYMKQPYYSV
jgi:hypothetical protein